jgi:hypothetical protein
MIWTHAIQVRHLARIGCALAGNNAGVAYDRQTIFGHDMHAPRECEMDSFDFAEG